MDEPFQGKQYRVWMHSKPGMWTHYDGHVDVVAYNTEDAVSRALHKLLKTSFPERPQSSWVIERVEELL